MIDLLSFDKSKIKFVLQHDIHTSARQTLRSCGYSSIDYFDSSLQEPEFSSAIAQARFLGIRGETKLTQEVLDRAEKLLAIGCFGSTTDNIDVEAAKQRGIPVFSAMYTDKTSIAELVIAEAIVLTQNVARNFSLDQAATTTPVDVANIKHDSAVYGKRWGIVGYGDSGAQVGLLAEAMGMEVVFSDVLALGPRGRARQVPLEELLRSSDIVSIHVPHASSKKPLIDQTEIAHMKTAGVLINASPMQIVNLKALADAVESQRLLGAALNTVELTSKPTSDASIDRSAYQRLGAMQNVLLLPHYAGTEQRTQYHIGIEVAQKLVKFSDTGSTVGAVNFPQVALPDLAPGQRRLLHIHRNQPGVLTCINRIFSNHQVNVSGQFLQTSAELGYVIFDIENEYYSQFAISQLKQVHGTIHCRILF
ncbi:MAG TPA: NAD(P)-dependent oxidoreductase [Pirellulaceae bacterium]|nr:NAD(P)-dependent oxidoreductase [Pirellulaceae bacterium]HMO90721.1 NAD(P)-dependent oxidoreductase [Pirellulaceae bacterium]HMP67972.1 NAD(P)-dependent oxidoreductase [Pirellulaceae bacterium]